MKEIVVDARMIDISGVGTYLQNLLRRLIQAPFRWRAILPPGAQDRFPWLKNLDYIPLDTRFYTLREQIDLPRVIPKCDLFWSPSFNIPLLPIHARRRLVTIHDVNQLVFPFQRNRWEKMFIKTLFLQAASRSIRVITDSVFSKDEIQKQLKVSEEKIQVIPLGVDSECFNENYSQDHLVKKKYDLPEDFILFIGNVKPHKNLLRLLLAFEKKLALAQHLVVIGRKEQAERGEDLSEFLKERPALKERAQFLGFVPSEDLPSLYRLAKAFVMPSLYEGFGLPILEAMRCGCPVVASDCASLPEVAGNHAIYVNPHDIEDIARGIETALSKGHLLKEKALGWSKCFSWDKAAEQHLEILEKI